MDAEAALRSDGVRAAGEVTPAPFLIDPDRYASLTVTPDGAASELERARTTLIEKVPWGSRLISAR